ncbi:MAG: hypothetical protein NMK33_05675 [Candidatus Cardinium sp.]|uniref:hypothetical protein n=1 Tax=Cardinium endosymbiont of Dermatophagoides farinae TaxID=2597823 RepID=UPI001183DF2E|nr:hypothetical protein [Cardinium endosymbiont of Dermatophagoides farinae]TSJ80895.1 hypothetical protein FPG78_02470 [Cardinium endosymbiont of Dermatophagoides farinae]UWW96907.1 MAG: hypothetical protein NMK33_05675 [Candidatus Cardinium sp.]
MKYAYKPILLSLCTAIFTGSKCTEQKLDEVKDTHNSVTKNHLHDKLQKEKLENDITGDKLFPICNKQKNTDHQNDRTENDLINEQKETELEVKENKLKETLKKKEPSELEITWKKNIPDGLGRLINFIDFILKDIKEEKSKRSYRSYYLLPECNVTSDKIEFLIKHHDFYLKALMQWCLKLPPKEQQVLNKKIENNSDGIYLEKVCMELAPDSKSKKSLADLLIEYIKNEIKEFPDFMSNKEILSKMPDNIKKSISRNIKIYKSVQQEGLKNLERISRNNTGNPQERSKFSRFIERLNAKRNIF